MKKLHTIPRHGLPVLIVVFVIGCMSVPALAADPLPSWRDGPNKQRIMAFVEQVTTPGGPSFVAPEDRVATFDMDGTALLEKPAYALFAFAIPLIKSAAAAQPALLERPHVKAIVDGDIASAPQAEREMQSALKKLMEIRKEYNLPVQCS